MEDISTETKVKKTTTTTPRPHPTRTSTTRSTVTACPTGSGSYYHIPDCLRKDGYYAYNNHVEGTCKPGTFVCFLPCSTNTKTSDSDPYCGCEINGKYTNDSEECEKMSKGLRTVGGHNYGNQSGKTTTTTPLPHPTKPLLTKTKSTTTTTTTTTSTSPRPHPTNPSSIVTACANGSGSSWRVPQCLAKHGHYYYDNYSRGSCKPGTFVCFIPCSEVKTTTKLLPTPITFDDIYCGCEINGEYTSDLKKCKRISRGLSVHGGHIYGNPNGNEGTTTSTTPRPHPTVTSTTTIIKPPCPTGTGSSWRIPDCVAKGGIYYYNNYLGKDTCSPGPFICYIPCSSSSTPANSENSVQINGKSYCGCEFNGEYTTNLRSCKYIAENTFKTTRYQKNFEKKTTTKRTTKRITTSTITISKKKHGEN